jgi:hypothetical protein
MRELRCDVLVAGGGVGGCAAALAAAESGSQVVLTEELPWIGGQLTSQGVPPDENPWIESFGGARSYQELRRRVRAYYRDGYPLKSAHRDDPLLNPGGGFVSAICAEPRVWLAALYSLLAPHLASGRIVLLEQHHPFWVDCEGDVIQSIEYRSERTAHFVNVVPKVVIDATETGEILPLAKAEYVVGAESQSQTGERNAPAEANPRNQQAITWCFAMGYDPKGDHTIAKPAEYSFWRNYQPAFWPGKLLGWDDVHPITLRARRLGLFPGDGETSMFEYRKIVDGEKYTAGGPTESVTLVNWPLNDAFLTPVVDVSEAEEQKGLHQARELSRCLLYWLQTEAPRPDGGTGYPGLRARGELMGSADGLAMAPYIREGRRLQAQYTVVEQDLSPLDRPGDNLAECYPDSVGIGYYRIDLHPSTGGDNYIDVPALPFRIPLRALVPVRVRNLLAGGKNLGVTHITNGCYRLHPVEWSVGEAAGVAAAIAALSGEAVQGIPFQRVQERLEARGVPLAWPENLELPAWCLASRDSGQDRGGPV